MRESSVLSRGCASHEEVRHTHVGGTECFTLLIDLPLDSSLLGPLRSRGLLHTRHNYTMDGDTQQALRGGTSNQHKHEAKAKMSVARWNGWMTGSRRSRTDPTASHPSATRAPGKLSTCIACSIVSL